MVVRRLSRALFELRQSCHDFDVHFISLGESLEVMRDLIFVDVKNDAGAARDQSHALR